MNLVEDCTCNNVFLIPYKNGNSRGIGLVEVLWKMVTEIMNFFLMVVIQFHNTLHGFRIVGGTGTTSCEAKLLQQLMDMMEKVIYEIFVDLDKTYGSLDCSRCL